MESKTKNRKTRAQIEAMATRAFRGVALTGGEDAVLELKEGWFNAAYDIRLAGDREVILKIAPPQDAEVMLYEKDFMTTEVASMRLVRQNRVIPVPEIYFFDDAHGLCDSDYFLMEKICGDNLEHVKAGLASETQTAIDGGPLQAGRWQRRYPQHARLRQDFLHLCRGTALSSVFAAPCPSHEHGMPLPQLRY